MRPPLGAALALLAAAIPAAAHAAVGGARLGAPVEFGLFGLVLAGVALFHRRALAIALAGLAAILAYQLLAGLADPAEAAARLARVRHAAEGWSTLANLFLLLIGFEVLARHFEQSRIPDRLPRFLPDNWTGGVVLLLFVLLMSAVLDNIAAALVGGVMARRVYRGRVRVAYVAAIAATANAGGAGSVIGDTTTTMMWLHGVAPLTMLPAYVGSAAAFVLVAVPAALMQQRRQPILKHEAAGQTVRWRRLAPVIVTLAAAVAANLVSNAAGVGEAAPWLGLAVWAAIALTAPLAPPDLRVVAPAAKGAVFLLALVASASLTPIGALPQPSWRSALGIGAVASVVDNIPLTALALRQGGYDWPLLAFAVGFGGSMLWFGSSAGVALTTLYPKGRSVALWLREGWFVPLAYLGGFFLMLAVRGWSPGPT
jgi:Na+/H+ antiporter NhaD/arsenite permease-like protein